MGKKPVEGNSKKAAGNAKKEASANAKREQEDRKKEVKEQEEWSKGAKSTDKKALEEEKKLEAMRKKAEKEALLKAEEEELAKIKPQQRQNKKADQKEFKINSFQANPVESFSASGIDAALDMMSVVDSGAKASSSDKLDRHPERRMKSAYLQFQEDRMPQLKAENPKLRLSQLNEMLQKEWKKSPQNPMNQQHLAHNSSREEERNVIAQKKAEKLESYKS